MRQPVVLVLASGRGERFVASGGTGSKLQALLGGKTVLQHTLDAVRASGLPWHLEDAGHEGMGDSIAAAVRATRQADGWLVLPGDLPLVRPADAARRRGRPGAARGGGAALPGTARASGRFRCGMRRGAVGAAADEQGAAHVVRAQAALNRMAAIEVDDPGIVADIDTVADLAEARRRLAAG